MRVHLDREEMLTVHISGNLLVSIDTEYDEVLIYDPEIDDPVARYDLLGQRMEGQ